MNKDLPPDTPEQTAGQATAEISKEPEEVAEESKDLKDGAEEK